MADETDKDDYVVIFRRFIKGKDGRLLDARQYGKKAWPIKVPAKK
jgi:hypothetical protein